MGKRILDFLLYIRPEPDRIEFLERLRLMVLYALIVPAIVSTVYNVMLVIRAGRYAVALLLCLSLIVGSLALVSFFRTRRLSGARRFMGLGFFLGSTLTILDAGGLYGLGSLYFLVAFAFGYLLFDYFMALALPVYFFAGFALRLQWGDFHPQSIYNDPDIATRVLIPFALSSFLGVVGNFSMRQLEERLSSLAYRDQATGLPNRAKFEELLRDEVVRSKESGRGFTLYAFKLHHLSRISGNRGVDYLNEVLQSFVDRMHDLCFPHGIVGRISESIFGLVLPEEPAADGRAREMIETLYDPLRGRDSIEYLQLSCGILRYPEDNIAPAELVRLSIALCERSDSAPGKVLLYDPHRTRSESEHFEIMTRLNRLVPENELYLVFQPKVDLETGVCSGAEVLVRWNTSKGEISPALFIPLAEENGSISKITRWVIHRTLSTVGGRSLLELGGRPLVYAINISVVDMRAPDFVEFLESLLELYAVPPSQIELELTERMLIDDDTHVRGNFAALQKLGVRLAIDDFGTGYSGLNYLNKFFVNTIKIDKSFVDAIEPGAQPGSLAVMEAVISLGIALGLELTAEGIEHAYQATYLAERRCHLGQGWLFSRPLSFEAFVDFAERCNLRESA